MSVQRVFIANRGEIAVRIVRACHELGLEAIAAYSEADKGGLSVKMADGAECVGGSRPLNSYLAIENIIKAAKDAGCDALHPGYGFLAESPVLARRCAESNITFIGPQAHVVERMGNKLEAREAVSKWGVPVAPGSSEVRDWEEARQIGDTIGYPIMVKAAAGGGGRGIKVIRGKLEVEESFKTASAEALAARGVDARAAEMQLRADAAAAAVVEHLRRVLRAAAANAALRQQLVLAPLAGAHAVRLPHVCAPPVRRVAEHHVPRHLAVHVLVEPRVDLAVALDRRVEVLHEALHVSVVADDEGLLAFLPHVRPEHRSQALRVRVLHHKVEVTVAVAVAVAVHDFGVAGKR